MGSTVLQAAGRRGPRRTGAGAGLRSDRALLAAVAALTVAGAVLRFQGLGQQGFWYDEGNTALLVRSSLGHMLGLIPQTESTPPLYYCIAWIWVRAFGHGEAGLRSLSALAGTLVVPVAYLAGARLISRRAGVIVAALAAFNPFLIWYAQEARAYSLLVLLAALSLLAFAEVRAAPAPGRLAAWVIASALAMATHYYAVVAVVPEALWLLWEHRRRRAVWIGVAAAAACGAALMPLVITQNGTGRDSWIAHSPLGIRLTQILPQFLIGTDAPARQALKDLAFALTLAGLVLLAARVRERERRGALVAGGLALGGFVMSLLFIASGNDTLITRNIIDLWLPAALMLSGGLAAGRTRAGRTAGAAICLGLCAIGLTATVSIKTDYSFQRPDWRPVARLLGPAPPRGASRLILIQHYAYLLPLSLYINGLHFDRGPLAHHVSEIDVISMVSPGQPLCWWGAACNLIPSQMQARYAIGAFHPVWRRHAHQFTVLRLRAARPENVSRAMVARALRTTTLRRDVLLIQRS